jgi:hypothetical protein
MTSRLTAIAAFFAVVATASLAYAAELHYPAPATSAAAAQAQVVQLERVVVTFGRLPAASR